MFETTTQASFFMLPVMHHKFVSFNQGRQGESIHPGSGRFEPRPGNLGEDGEDSPLL